MKPKHLYGALAVWCVVFFALIPSTRAQNAAAPRHIGVPQDWSQHQIVFSRDALAKHPELIDREPRILHQVMQRWQVPEFGAFQGVEPRAATKPVSISPNKTGMHRDWNVTLPGRLGPNMFPAKYSFDPAAAPDCNNDYVVFGLGDVGVTGGRPNLVAYNNLYSDPPPGSGGGLCDPPIGPGLSVLFAYNITTVTGGRISTSPILSLDGTKIGFVESIPGATPQAIFHVLTWTAGDGTLLAAAAPGSMIALPISGSANATTSSPWIDYGNDIVYVGTDDGNLYQITGVFNGTPTLTGGNWPITVALNNHLTPPVLDSGLGLLMVGAGNGNLYQIDTATGVVLGTPLAVGAIGNTTPGIVAPPIVDVTNGTTFAVSANDGTSAVLVEADTFTMTEMARARIGQGSTVGTPAPAVHIYQPAFSNDYFNDPSTGVVTICGTGAAETSPYQYTFGFVGPLMNTTSVALPVQLLTSTAARCSGWTEFFNPNVGVAGTDFLFFGLTQDCTAAGAAGGCLIALSSDPFIPTATVTLTRGPSGIVVDNYSTAAQAASIYTMAEGANVAYKFTQNGLQ